MTMSKLDLKTLKRAHKDVILLNGDEISAFEFVLDVIEFERDTLKKRCSYASNTIARLENAMRVVSELLSDIENSLYEEV